MLGNVARKENTKNVGWTKTVWHPEDEGSLWMSYAFI